MRTAIRWSLRVGVAAVIVAALAYALWPRPVPVDLATVGRGPFEVAIRDDGEARVRDIYVISAPVAGRVVRFGGEVGDPVLAGETILTQILPTDPGFLDIRARTSQEAAVRTAEAAVALAEADLNRASASVDYADSQFERAVTLEARGTIPRAELDRARLEQRTRRAELETARAALRVREAELDAARAALIGPGDTGLGTDPESCCVLVHSPVDGAILLILQESEAVVVAGAPLVEVGDPDQLEIVVDLLSTDAVRVTPGDPVVIEDWGGPQALAGVVRRVEPFARTRVSSLGIEEQRVDIRITLSDPPEAWARLGHGYHVNARIVIRREEDAVQVPIGALFRERGAWTVFRVANGRARIATVEIGAINGSHAEVLGGLSPGDRVVLHPSNRVADGVAITDRGAEESTR